MAVFHLPPAVEIGRLRRLRETVTGGAGARRSSIVAADDWIAEIDARLGELERALGLPTDAPPRPPAAPEICLS